MGKKKKSLLQAKLKEFQHFKQFYPELEQLGYFIILLPVGLFCQICLSLVSRAGRFYFGPVDSITQRQSFMDNYFMPNAVHDWYTRHYLTASKAQVSKEQQPSCCLISYLYKSTVRKASRMSLLQALCWYCQSCQSVLGLVQSRKMPRKKKIHYKSQISFCWGVTFSLSWTILERLHLPLPHH